MICFIRNISGKLTQSWSYVSLEIVLFKKNRLYDWISGSMLALPL